MTHLHAIVIFCRDPYLMADFWAVALDQPPVPEDAANLAARSLPPGESILLRRQDHPDVWITPVDHLDPPGNRLHLDIQVEGDDIARLLDAGATVVREEPRWTVLKDPEGNEFCAVPKES